MGLFEAPFDGNDKPTQHNESEAWQTFYNGLPVDEENNFIMTPEQQERGRKRDNEYSH